MTFAAASGRDRYALLSWLATEFGAKGRLGKKAIQKLVHILDEGLLVSTGYRFSLYTYGAFSRDLAGDIDISSSLGAIEVEYVEVDNRYIVSAGTEAEALIHSSRFLALNSDSLSRLKVEFSEESARGLELFSTLLFLERRKPGAPDAELVDELLQLKPKYNRYEADSGLGRVRKFISSAKAT